MKKLLIGLLFCIPAWAEFVVPATPYPVNDYAGILTEHDKNMIAEKMVLLKTMTNVQLGILIVDSLDGTPIEVASMKVVESWKLGSKTSDDGMLLMLTIKEHKSRIEVGQGLEGVLTDIQSGRILRSMHTDLRHQNYAQALSGAVDEISSTIVANKQNIMSRHVDTNMIPWGSILLTVLGISGLILIFMGIFRKKKPIKQEKSFYSGLGVPQAPYKKGHVENKHVDPYVAPIIVSRHSDYGGYSSSDDVSISSGSSDSSSNASDWSGGGGDFSGGGASDSW